MVTAQANSIVQAKIDSDCTFADNAVEKPDGKIYICFSHFVQVYVWCRIRYKQMNADKFYHILLGIYEKKAVYIVRHSESLHFIIRAMKVSLE